MMQSNQGNKEQAAFGELGGEALLELSKGVAFNLLQFVHLASAV